MLHNTKIHADSIALHYAPLLLCARLVSPCGEMQHSVQHQTFLLTTPHNNLADWAENAQCPAQVSSLL